MLDFLEFYKKHTNNVETPNLGVSTKWQSGSLGVIINQYKCICTINARKINKNFAWQTRFYKHIIRNKKSYEEIVQYIFNNPLKWEDDKYYVK